MASEIDPNTCWLWAGTKDPRGYGYIYVRRLGKPYHPKQAHRVIYEALVGEIPKGLHIDHLCRVPSCVNPSHLEPVTLRENVLRGVGVSAKNAKKIHCPIGHLLDQISRNKDKEYRRCSTCHKLAERERRIKLSQAK